MASALPKGNFHHEGLLVIPAPHSPPFSWLKDAYGPAMREALTGVHETVKGTSQTAVLDVAVGIKRWQFQHSSLDPKIYTSLQRLLANLYKLAALVAAQANIDLDVPGGVDIRMFFLTEDHTTDPAMKYDMFPTIYALAASKRSWTSLWIITAFFGTYCESRLLESLDRNGKTFDRSKVHHIKPAFSGSPYWQPPPNFEPSHHYSVAVGGTFDHLHIGHKLLLSAVWLAVDPNPPAGTTRLITVGITGDELLVNKKFAQVLESWDQRWKSCWNYFESVIDFTPSEPGDTRLLHRVDEPGPNGKYVLVDALPDLQIKFVQISDTYGPTITDEGITALVVSGETRSGGKAVNDKRREKGWKDLEIFEVDVLDLREEDTNASQESFESKISSTGIRKRMMEINKGSL
ncbi:hypothetical protein KEM56_000696 [Ascosphaera pollenicola]|nr:hypothetical protein KEM56_000696 [Ascosphaera pollenicola]